MSGVHDSGRIPEVEVVPLVMHRIVTDGGEAFEDIHVSTLEWLLEKVAAQWVTFGCVSHTGGRGWLLTFDDGYDSDYEFVFPRLLAHGQKAVFFLIVDRIGTSGYLDWMQVREMHQYGMEFGSHGLSHRRMDTLPEDEVRKELAHSRARLEDALGVAVRAFSFPFGAYSRRLIRMAGQQGFEICCISDHGVCRPPFSLVPRNSIHAGMNRMRIEKTMEADPWIRRRWLAEDAAKKTAKRWLGERWYESLRRVLAGR